MHKKQCPGCKKPKVSKMSKTTDFQKDEVLVKPKTEREKEWLKEEIEVEFYNIEEPGLMLTFNYGTTKNNKRYKLMHGGKYRLPREVVNHIESRSTPMWKWRPDGLGGLSKSLVGSKPRFQCKQVFV